MTLTELQNVWYNGNRNDINFVNTCYNLLTGMNVLMYRDMREYMEVWVYESID